MSTQLSIVVNEHCTVPVRCDRGITVVSVDISWQRYYRLPMKFLLVATSTNCGGPPKDGFVPSSGTMLTHLRFDKSLRDLVRDGDFDSAKAPAPRRTLCDTSTFVSFEYDLTNVCSANVSKLGSSFSFVFERGTLFRHNGILYVVRAIQPIC